MEKVSKTTINLYKRQIEWVKKNHFMLSPFVREQLDNEIQRRGK